MPRIAGVDIPDNKPIRIALRYIYGVGPKHAEAILDEAKIDGQTRANKLSAMAGVLNVSIMWLLTGEGEGMSAPPPETLSGSDLSGVLADIRHLRSELAAAEQRAGLLEARIAKLAGEASE